MPAPAADDAPAANDASAVGPALSGLVGLAALEELLRAYAALAEAKGHLLSAWQVARWDEARAGLLLLVREAGNVQDHAALLLKLLFAVDPARTLRIPSSRPALPHSEDP